MIIHNFECGNFLVRIFQDKLIDERMYVICAHEEAIVVDPHVDEDILSYLNNISKVDILLTHEHYDHISGVNWLKERFACCVYATSVCASSIEEMNNGTSYFPFLFIGDREKYHYVKNNIKLPYSCRADVIVEKRLELELSSYNILLWATPGHSPGGMSVLVDNRYLFSGDNLLGNGMELKSIDADSEVYMKTINEYCELLNKKIIVFPGHGEIDDLDNYIFKVKEYYKWN